MRKKLNFAAIISCILIPSCACADLPYLNYSVDLQLPGSPLNLDCTYVGNTPLLKFFVFDNDVPYTASGYTWTFFYGSSPTATSGVSMASYNISSNAVSFFSATNLFSRSGLYYVSLIMTSTSGLRRTVASGTMKQKFDAGANLPGISPYVYPFNWNLYSSFIGQWPISSANSALLITTNGTNGSLILAVQTGVATNGFNGVVNTYGGTNNASFDGSSRILTMNFAPISAASTNGINSVAYTTNNAGIITFSGNILSSGTNLPASGAGSITNVASGDTNFVFVTGGAGPNTVVAPTSRATNDFALAEGAYPSSNPSGFAGSNSVSLRLASNTWAAADSTTNYALRTAFNASTNALWANFAQYLLLGGGTMTGTVLFTTPISTFGISGSTNLASGYNGLSLVDNWGHQTVDWYPTSDKTSPGPLLAGDVMYYNLGVWSGYPITNLFQSWLQSNVWDAANGLAVTNNRLTSNAIPALTARDTNWLTAVTGQVSVTSRATNDFALAENASNTAGNLINVSTAVLARISSFDASNSFYAASNPSGFSPQSPWTNDVNAARYNLSNLFRLTIQQTNTLQAWASVQNNQYPSSRVWLLSATRNGTNYYPASVRFDNTNTAIRFLTIDQLATTGTPHLVTTDNSVSNTYSMVFEENNIDSNVLNSVNGFLTINDREILTHAGNISHDMAKEIAEAEYGKFRAEQIQRSDAAGGDFEKAIQLLPPRRKPKKAAGD